MSSSKHNKTEPHVNTKRYDIKEHFLMRGDKFSLLLAVAHDDVAASAIRVAHALESERNAIVTAVQVIDPSPYATPFMVESLMLAAESLIGPAATEERKKDIAEQIKNAIGKNVNWPISYRLGDPTGCIADEAHRLKSGLLVIGLHHHGKVARLFGEETTVRAMSNAGIPVLAVTKGLNGLPDNVLVAIDFGQASVNVARLASRLVAKDGQITLAYVQADVQQILEEDFDGAEAIQKEGINAAFAKIVSEIETETGLRPRTVVLNGDPAKALLEYAQEIETDLIAVASQRHSLTTRLLLGSVSRTILRDGRWSVFVTPP